ncbi:MAG: glycosyltransferase family 39 protein [Syntrophobacterales bacterium]|jgi:cytochrome c-type biogenesis protein CcmH/NrfG
MKKNITISLLGRDLQINLAFITILFFGLIFKGVYLYSYALNNPHYSIASMDSAVYLNWAYLILEEGWLGTEIFYRAPFYPYLLSIIFWFAPNNLLAVYIMQLVMGMCSVVLIYSIGKRIYCERAGLIAAGFSLLYSPLTFFETKILPTTTGIFLGLLSIYLLTRAEQEKKWCYWMSGAATLGVAALCRPNYLLMIPLLIFGILVVHRKRLRETPVPILILILIPSVIVGTVTLRNYVVGKDFVLISANAGITFAQGNNPWARGSIAVLPEFSGEVNNQRHEETQIAERVTGRKLKPSEVNTFWFKWGLTFIQEKPLEYLRLLLYKAAILFNNHELGNNYLLDVDKEVTPWLRLAFLPFGFIMAWAVIGFARIFLERPAALALLAAFIGGFLTAMIFYVNSRYRMALLPPAIILAGGGLDYLVRNPRRFGGILLTVGLTFAISLSPFLPLHDTQLSRSHSRAWAHLGDAYRNNNQLEKALWAYENAIGMEPNNYGYYLEKLKLFGALGKSKDEITEWAQQVTHKISREQYRYLIIAEAYYSAKDYDKATEYIQKALSPLPKDPRLYLYSGILLGRMGKHHQAREVFSEGLKKNPENIDLHYNYALACFMSGDKEEAMQAARKILRHAPYFDKARSLLRQMAREP